MDHTSEMIEANLASRDPERIGSVLRELKARMVKGNSLPIAPLDLELLKVFGNDVPVEIQLLFLDLTMFYADFSPAMSIEQRVATAIALVLRYAESYISFEAALDLKIAKPGTLAIQIAMSQIAIQGLTTPASIRGARGLVSRLLDGKPEEREAVVHSITRWPKEKPYLDLIRNILPQLKPDEVNLLTQHHLIQD